ncbi:MAG: amidohydrolase family protein [Bacteroidota bacterium]
MVENFFVFDAHTHFFSFNFYRLLIEQKEERESLETELERIQEKTKIEIPPGEPKKLADRWITEMDKYEIHRIVAFASLPGDESSISEAISAYPERLIGYFMVNPTLPHAADITERNLRDLRFKGILLFPAMYHFHVYEPRLEPIYELAQKYHVPVFTHFGILKVKIRDVIGLPSAFDGTFANPTDLHRTAIRFPRVNFIVPHFGAGYFREVLFLGEQCRNVYVDTSSSNSWMQTLPYSIDLKTVFQKAVSVFGADRILYGSDSGVFPRGYRVDVLQSQLQTLRDLQLPDDHIQKILGRNLLKLLKISQNVES